MKAVIGGPSKILDRKWKLEMQEMHKRKLRQVKSTIREQYMQNPNNAHNANRNGKKERMMERKYNS